MNVRLPRLCACILMLATASSLPAVMPSVSAAAQTRSTARSGFSLQSQRFRSGGWRWQLTAAMGADRILGFTMVARRTPQGESAPLEVHDWHFRLATRDLTVDHADLMPTRLNTGTDLG
ncbi:MAG: hypothetical protein M3O29_06675, partial [Actinomycetota bacterium]|nr:hypothetical protein [Actinomycetota bacterium]